MNFDEAYFARECEQSGPDSVLVIPEGTSFNRGLFIADMMGVDPMATITTADYSHSSSPFQGGVPVQPVPTNEHDPVSNPSHYVHFAIEPITFIMANNLPFPTGSVVKYVCRAPYKNGIEDLKKARRMLDMMIEQEENPRSVERL